MTTSSKSLKHRPKTTRSTKAAVRQPGRHCPLPDVFVDGKRKSTGPTIFDPRYSKSK